MTWEGFQELIDNRKAKGFNAVQVVCGPYPDEAMMEARWENEGGKPVSKAIPASRRSMTGRRGKKG